SSRNRSCSFFQEGCRDRWIKEQLFCMLHSTTSDLLGSNEHGMAYRVPTAVNRAYAKVPIERPRASVHVLVPTLTLRRLALELTGATSFGSTARLGSSLQRGFEAFLCFYLLRALSSVETSIEGKKKIPGGRMPSAVDCFKSV